jgi:RHS repeat-associated protein
MIYSGSAGTETTYYASPLFEAVVTSAGTDYRHYIYANGRPVVVISRTTAGAINVHSLLLDHQGSISTIVADATGTAAATESFSAFGNRREAATWGGSPTSTELAAMNGVTREGYTFQTVLGSMGLNHMNGRIEDSVTGRFLSADPIGINQGDTRSFNRYSYVNNNPLTYVDPSGFDGCDPDTECVVMSPRPSTEPASPPPVITDGTPGITVWGSPPGSDNSPETDISSPYPQAAQGSNGVKGGTPGGPDELVVTASKPPPDDFEQIVVTAQGIQNSIDTLFVTGKRMLPCDQQNGANATIGPLLDAATNAYNAYPFRPIDMIFPFSALRGTAIHTYFAGEVRALGPLYSAEVSYLNGVPVPFGTFGSVRTDAIVGPINAPFYAVELKSGAARPSAAETAAYYRNLPPGTGLCSIVEGM